MEAHEWIEAQRLGQGLSVYALANKAGLKHHHLAAILRGETIPRADTLEKIYLALGNRYPGPEVSVDVITLNGEEVGKSLKRLAGDIRGDERLNDDQRKFYLDLASILARYERSRRRRDSDSPPMGGDADD